jgi:hypothetical protein
MRTILALCLVALASLVNIACQDNIPSTVARALAVQEEGGYVVDEFRSYEGLATYTILVCNKDEKVVKINVFGDASKPQTEHVPQDLGLSCGSRSEFWKLYDEKAANNPALKEEFAKFKELFGLNKSK